MIPQFDFFLLIFFEKLRIQKVLLKLNNLYRAVGRSENPGVDESLW